MSQMEAKIITTVQQDILKLEEKLEKRCSAIETNVAEKIGKENQKLLDNVTAVVNKSSINSKTETSKIQKMMSLMTQKFQIEEENSGTSDSGNAENTESEDEAVSD